MSQYENLLKTRGRSSRVCQNKKRPLVDVENFTTQADGSPIAWREDTGIKTRVRSGPYRYPSEEEEQEKVTDPIPELSRNSKLREEKHRWVLWVAGTVVVLFVLWVGASKLLWEGTMVYDNFVYGTPRTFKIDQRVGHNDKLPNNPSHFEVLNLDTHVQILEWPGNAYDHSPRLYRVEIMQPTFQLSRYSLFPDMGSKFLPVTLTFKDVDGDGKIDMVVNIWGTQVVGHNNGTVFLLPTKKS